MQRSNVVKKNCRVLLAAILLAVMASGCASAGLRIIQPLGTKFSKYSSAGILVTDRVSTNTLAVLIDKRYKSSQATNAEKQMLKTALISRLLSEKKFQTVYDYEKKGPKAQLFMDVTIKKFDFNADDYFVLLDGSMYLNTFDIRDFALASSDQTANLLINIVFYDETAMNRICELDLIVVKEHLEGPRTEFGEEFAFKTYEEFLINKAIDELMAFIHSNS